MKERALKDKLKRGNPVRTYWGVYLSIAIILIIILPLIYLYKFLVEGRDLNKFWDYFGENVANLWFVFLAAAAILIIIAVLTRIYGTLLSPVPSLPS